MHTLQQTRMQCLGYKSTVPRTLHMDSEIACVGLHTLDVTISSFHDKPNHPEMYHSPVVVAMDRTNDLNSDARATSSSYISSRGNIMHTDMMHS